MTPIYIAARFNHVNIAKLLLEKGVDLNKVMPLPGKGERKQQYFYYGTGFMDIRDRHTPLFVVASRGYSGMVELLIKYGADVSAGTTSDRRR